MVWKVLACIAVGFLLGGWNGAILISRLKMHEDVREKGSGNAGLTNFLRSYGGWATLLVVLIDFGKTIAACLIATLILPEEPLLAKMVAGVAVQIGHIFPAYFGFQGGKGVLCSGAVGLMLDWRIFLIAIAVFFIVFFLTRYVSLASMLGMIVFSVLAVIFYTEQPIIWGLVILMTLTVIFMHRSNITRLLHGKERKTYFHKYKNEREAN
ncbi:MAG: acyl-phosphate glycerol 3-phosphate acyltransferase [Clostridiales bacterium]|nr:acyl-phosphate glycerol 3-phosphate acyltransferase [Clostridiales bacterium]